MGGVGGSLDTEDFPTGGEVRVFDGDGAELEGRFVVGSAPIAVGDELGCKDGETEVGESVSFGGAGLTGSSDGLVGDLLELSWGDCTTVMSGDTEVH